MLAQVHQRRFQAESSQHEPNSCWSGGFLTCVGRNRRVYREFPDLFQIELPKRDERVDGSSQGRGSDVVESRNPHLNAGSPYSDHREGRKRLILHAGARGDVLRGRNEVLYPVSRQSESYVRRTAIEVLQVQVNHRRPILCEVLRDRHAHVLHHITKVRR